MLLNSDDCRLLARYQESKPWNDAPEEDREAIKELRGRLKTLAAEAVGRYSGSTIVREFASHPNPNGRTPKELWCCIYPTAVPNKSYGLQIALIVMESGIEICFCLGAGTGQINNAEARRKSEFALSHLKAGLQRLPLATRQELNAAIGDQWAYRQKWRLPPGPSDFEGLNAWLEFAATSTDGGASISRYWSTDDLAAGTDVAEEFHSACAMFQPLLDASYVEIDDENSLIPDSDFLRLMRSYADDRVVFLSPNRKARYRISDVDDRGCTVNRLDADRPERVTEAAYKTQREWLREQGGTSPRVGLDNTTAKQMCYLQSADMTLGADRGTAVLLTAPEQTTAHFIDLIEAMQTFKLYKPVILALIVEAIRDEEITHNHFEFDWLLPRFIARLHELGHEVGEQQLAEGFGRMASDLFWLHAYREPVELIALDGPTPTQIRERISHARLQEPFWIVLQEHEYQQQVLDALARKWWPNMTDDPIEESDLSLATEQLIVAIGAKGFIFQPWQIATYITAMRTKPFVILAGVSGTGKSKLPALVSELTSGVVKRISVRPDWTDSSDVLGYVDLNNKFRSGLVLEAAREASRNASHFHVCLIDEMNLARVEHYFAEVLSTIEDRRPARDGGYESTSLITQKLTMDPDSWQSQNLPANFGIVGTVNMDESSHGFSRKVLDRAFTLELSEVDLSLDNSTPANVEINIANWPKSFWQCRATRISEADSSTPEYRHCAESATMLLQDVNQCLVHSQLQVGYRTRDEVILFLLNAEDSKEAFRTREGQSVDPLDLAIMMKVLPRLVGGSNAIRRTMMGLIGIAKGGQPFDNEDDAASAVEQWAIDGRPDAIEGARYPRTASRLCLMWDRLTSEGYTSFWL